MRVNRRLLYWGVVLLAIGGVLVAAELTAVPTTTLADIIRLWPLAIVAIGVSLIARRTRFALPALLTAALIPGLVVGAAFAVAPRFADYCGGNGGSASVVSQHGTFDGPATVSIRGGCGVLHVSTAPGSGWKVNTATTSTRSPSVHATSSSLKVDTSSDGMAWLDPGRDIWDVTLPQADLNHVTVVVTTGDGRADLRGAQIGDLAVTANAGRLFVDASQAASLRELNGVVNVGAMTLSLPATTDIDGSLKVGAGKLELCTAPGLGVRITSQDTGGNVSVGGLDQVGGVWESPDYATAAHKANLDVRVTFGAVDINPIGGCK
jgi:hypothetical protein